MFVVRVEDQLASEMGLQPGEPLMGLPVHRVFIGSCNNARLPDLQRFAAEHGLKIGTIADLIEHRSRNESLIEKVGAAGLDVAFHSHPADCHGVVAFGRYPLFPTNYTGREARTQQDHRTDQHQLLEVSASYPADFDAALAEAGA